MVQTQEERGSFNWSGWSRWWWRRKPCSIFRLLWCKKSRLCWHHRNSPWQVSKVCKECHGLKYFHMVIRMPHFSLKEFWSRPAFYKVNKKESRHRRFQGYEFNFEVKLKIGEMPCSHGGLHIWRFLHVWLFSGLCILHHTLATLDSHERFSRTEFIGVISQVKLSCEPPETERSWYAKVFDKVYVLSQTSVWWYMA